MFTYKISNSEFLTLCVLHESFITLKHVNPVCFKETFKVVSDFVPGLNPLRLSLLVTADRFCSLMPNASNSKSFCLIYVVAMDQEIPFFTDSLKSIYFQPINI
ncbi:MAG: hypothetical protein RLY43_1287 [Bacteroidota bacterium]|jgi:hypothetical protein